MGVTMPLVPSTWVRDIAAAYNACNSRGVYVDHEGHWDVEFDTLRGVYILCHQDTKDTKMIPRGVYLQKVYGYKAFSPVGQTPGTWETTREGLVYRRTSRWRKKVDYLNDKAWERRIRPLVKLGWAVMLFWGSILLLVLTSYLLKWAVHVVLG